jgi:histidinol-phosphate aminotransferase
VTGSAPEFAAKLAQLPHYEGGMDIERARRTYEASDVIKLASNESPWGPHPAVLEAVAKAAADANRYPDQYASLLRRRIADRFDREPGGIAVSNGSCEILLAASLALCEPGAELVYAWPSFSMYPQLAPLSGAREIRVPLNDRYEHDLDAIATEVTVATRLVIVCNPNNPTGTCLPAERIAAFLERIPGYVTVILDEAYIEMQVLDHPDATTDLLDRFPNLVLLRTFSKVYGLAGLRCGYALCSPRFRAAVDAVRQPFSVNLLSQAAGAEALNHEDDVRDRVERTVAERIGVEEDLHDLGLTTAETQTNFSWIDLGDRDEAEVVEGLGRAGVIVRPGTPLGGPGHIRVSYGTPEENERFIDALRPLL